MDRKIIILSRISTSPQDIQSQTNDLIRESERLGFDKDHQIIIESVESAIKLSEEERLGLQKMKHCIETDPSIDCVICWEPSRLARQQTVLYGIRDYLVSHKIQLIILNPYVRLLTQDRTQVDTTANIVFSLFATTIFSFSISIIFTILSFESLYEFIFSHVFISNSSTS